MKSALQISQNKIDFLQQNIGEIAHLACQPIVKEIVEKLQMQYMRTDPLGYFDDERIDTKWYEFGRLADMGSDHASYYRAMFEVEQDIGTMIQSLNAFEQKALWHNYDTASIEDIGDGEDWQILSYNLSTVTDTLYEVLEAIRIEGMNRATHEWRTKILM